MKPGALVRVTCVAFCSGITAASMIQPLGYGAVFFMVGAFGIFLAAAVPRWKAACLLAAAFSLGVWHMDARASDVVNSVIDEGYRTLTGRIQFVEQYANKQRLRLAVEAPSGGAPLRMFVYAARYPEYGHGEYVRVRCDVRAPRAFDEFRFDLFLARKNIQAYCMYPRIERLKTIHPATALIFSAKEWYARRLLGAFHEPESALARAMLLAKQEEIPPNLSKDFSRAGISHLIAISGLNMTILIFLFEYALIAVGLSPATRWWSNAIFIFLYLVILGFPASAVRAGIMGLIIIGAKIIGRPVQGLHLLLVTATLMIIHNPLILAFDPGFQLSFAAMAGILTTYNWWRRMLGIVPDALGFRSMVAVTCAAQMFTLPLVMYYFHVLSVISLIANILVVPLMPAVLILGLSAPLAAGIPLAEDLTAWPLFFILRWIVLVGRAGSRVPGAVYEVPPVWAELMLVVYGCIAIAALVRARVRRKWVRV